MIIASLPYVLSSDPEEQVREFVGYHQADQCVGCFYFWATQRTGVFLTDASGTRVPKTPDEPCCVYLDFHGLGITTPEDTFHCKNVYSAVVLIQMLLLGHDETRALARKK